jgi:hypothetical protein
MEIVDISSTGLGILVPDSDIKFESGSELTDCRIRHPMCPSISVTLKVIFVGKRRLSDGRLQARVGCQIIGDAADVAELVSMFSMDL